MYMHKTHTSLSLQVAVTLIKCYVDCKTFQAVVYFNFIYYQLFCNINIFREFAMPSKVLIVMYMYNHTHQHLNIQNHHICN